MAAWYAAFASGGSDRGQVAMAMGRIGRAHPEPVSRAARRAVVRVRLVSTDWPAALQVTALDTDTGELHVFDACCGVSLLGAVAASGAVPGVWPLERFAGRFWIDGGMVSAANAHLASGYWPCRGHRARTRRVRRHPRRRPGRRRPERSRPGAAGCPRRAQRCCRRSQHLRPGSTGSRWPGTRRWPRARARLNLIAQSRRLSASPPD